MYTFQPSIIQESFVLLRVRVEGKDGEGGSGSRVRECEGGRSERVREGRRGQRTEREREGEAEGRGREG